MANDPDRPGKKDVPRRISVRILPLTNSGWRSFDLLNV